jgi:hypothetical protein
VYGPDGEVSEDDSDEDDEIEIENDYGDENDDDDEDDEDEGEDDGEEEEGDAEFQVPEEDGDKLPEHTVATLEDAEDEEALVDAAVNAVIATEVEVGMAIAIPDILELKQKNATDVARVEPYDYPDGVAWEYPVVESGYAI